VRDKQALDGVQGAVGIVAEVRGIACASFNGHAKAKFDELFHHLGDGGNTFFARENLPWHANALRLRVSGLR